MTALARRLRCWLGVPKPATSPALGDVLDLMRRVHPLRVDAHYVVGELDLTLGEATNALITLEMQERIRSEFVRRNYLYELAGKP